MSSQSPIRRRNARRRAGMVTVEFAVTASVLFMTIFAMFEFSRYYFVQHGVQMVAYEAARAGIIPGASAADVQARADELLVATGIPVANVIIDPTEITPQTRNVSVTVSCDFADNSWIPPTYLTGRTIATTITLQHENNAYLDPEDDEDIGDLIGDNTGEPVDL